MSGERGSEAEGAQERERKRNENGRKEEMNLYIYFRENYT